MKLCEEKAMEKSVRTENLIGVTNVEKNTPIMQKIALHMDLITLHMWISNAVEVMRKISRDHNIDLDIPAITVNAPNMQVVAEESCSERRIIEDPEKLVFPDHPSLPRTTNTHSDTAPMIGLSPPPHHRKHLRKSRTYSDIQAAASVPGLTS
jgi:hypothetical protein